MKKTFLLIVCSIAITTSLYAQLKVNQYGRIGMGIDPHPTDKLLIKGDLCLTTYPEIPTSLSSWGELKFKIGTGWPGATIGATPERKIAFWSDGYGENGWNVLYAAAYLTGSDISIKTNISPIEKSLEKILQLTPYSYNLKEGSAFKQKITFGFLAQDVHKILPNVTDTAKGIMLMDYQQIIPLLVGAVKQQQQLIDSLKRKDSPKEQMPNVEESSQQQVIESLMREVNEIKSQIAECCDIKQEHISISSSALNPVSSVLYQNRPNPFSEKTTIEFEISSSFRSASILIFDMQGTLKKTIPINQNGKGAITINGFELTAGMYLYSLIVDDKEIDTKRMILMN